MDGAHANMALLESCTNTTRIVLVMDEWIPGVTYQVLKDTLVQLPFGRTALPKLLVVVLKACPVLTELFQA